MFAILAHLAVLAVSENLVYLWNILAKTGCAIDKE